MKVHQPHDGFCKKSLSNVEVAKDLLQAHLAPELVRRIDWKSLLLTNKSYVDEDLNQLHSDVVYRCLMDGKEAYIYTVIEQQTEPDPLLPFRVLKYIVSLLQEHLDQGNKRLPVVVSLLLYSGEKTPYPHSVDIYDCFEDPALARALMFKPLDLIDLGQISEEELAKHGTADLVQILLKQSHARTFLAWIKQHPELMLRLLNRRYGISGIMYILGVENEYSAEEITKAIVAIKPDKKEEIMTAAQQLEHRGRQEGRQEEKLGIARNMLSKLHLDANTVHQATGLSWLEIEQLLQEKPKSKPSKA